MSMTLEQLLFQVREALYDAKRYGAGDWSYLTDAIGAHLTQPAQSVDVSKIPDAKPLPDLMMASYHEAIGWNAYREAMLNAALQEKGNGSL